jgi:hypothetical protein
MDSNQTDDNPDVYIANLPLEVWEKIIGSAGPNDYPQIGSVSDASLAILWALP